MALFLAQSTEPVDCHSQRPIRQTLLLDEGDSDEFLATIHGPSKIAPG
jgi:hypothetical protein